MRKEIYFIVIVIFLSMFVGKVEAQEAELSPELKKEILDSISQTSELARTLSL